MTKQKKTKKQDLRVQCIERDAIEWVQKHMDDLLAAFRSMGRIEYFEARQFAKKAYRAGFANAMARMGIWPLEDNNKKMREVLKSKKDE